MRNYRFQRAQRDTRAYLPRAPCIVHVRAGSRGAIDLEVEYPLSYQAHTRRIRPFSATNPGAMINECRSEKPCEVSTSLSTHGNLKYAQALKTTRKSTGDASWGALYLCFSTRASAMGRHRARPKKATRSFSRAAHTSRVVYTGLGKGESPSPVKAEKCAVFFTPYPNLHTVLLL